MSKKTEAAPMVEPPAEPTEAELQTLVQAAEVPVVADTPPANPVHVTERRSFARASAEQPVKVTTVTGHNSGV